MGSWARLRGRGVDVAPTPRARAVAAAGTERNTNIIGKEIKEHKGRQVLFTLQVTKSLVYVFLSDELRYYRVL